MLAEDFAPVAMLGFLKHPLASGGLLPAMFRAQVRRWKWTAPRLSTGPGLAGLRDRLTGQAELSGFFERPLPRRLPICGRLAVTGASLASLAIALGNAAERMAARSRDGDGVLDAADGALYLWANEDGVAAATLLASLAEQGDGFATDVESFPHMIAQLAACTVGGSVDPPRPAILGPVEARMQSVDRLILGGFSEGNWPLRPEIDPWTNAEMRRAAGLQPHTGAPGSARGRLDGQLRAGDHHYPCSARR